MHPVKLRPKHRQYPPDQKKQNRRQRVLDGLNQLLALVIAGEKTEGGTMLVPGHGRISDEADLVEYRDMVTIVRDRVSDAVGKGSTLAQIAEMGIARDYDRRYGAADGPASASAFLETVYRAAGN